MIIHVKQHILSPARVAALNLQLQPGLDAVGGRIHERRARGFRARVLPPAITMSYYTPPKLAMFMPVKLP